MLHSACKNDILCRKVYSQNAVNTLVNGHLCTIYTKQCIYLLELFAFSYEVVHHPNQINLCQISSGDCVCWEFSSVSMYALLRTACGAFCVRKCAGCSIHALSCNNCKYTKLLLRAFHSNFVALEFSASERERERRTTSQK